MFTFATKQSSIVKLWGEGFTLYRDAFLKIWYILLILMLISGLLQYAIKLVPLDNLMNTKHGINRDAIFLGLITAVSLMVQFYCIGLIFNRIYNVGLGADLKLSKAMKLIRSKYWSLCSTTAAVFALVLLGILLLVIPGIFLGIALMFSIPVVICQDTTAWKAITTSFKLVWGHWWRTVAVFSPIFFIQMLYTSILVWVAHKNSLALNVVNILVSTLFSSLLYAFILVQFNDLKLRANKKAMNNE